MNKFIEKTINIHFAIYFTLVVSALMIFSYYFGFLDLIPKGLVLVGKDITLDETSHAYGIHLSFISDAKRYLIFSQFIVFYHAAINTKITRKSKKKSKEKLRVLSEITVTILFSYGLFVIYACYKGALSYPLIYTIYLPLQVVYLLLVYRVMISYPSRKKSKVSNETKAID